MLANPGLFITLKLSLKQEREFLLRYFKKEHALDMFAKYCIGIMKEYDISPDDMRKLLPPPIIEEES